MMGGIHEYNKTGQMKRPSYKDIVAWIVEIWAAVSENCVTNEAVSGDSDYIHDDTFSEMEEEGMEEIPKEILNAIDSFNVEPDEEFLGFE